MFYMDVCVYECTCGPIVCMYIWAHTIVCAYVSVIVSDWILYLICYNIVIVKVLSCVACLQKICEYFTSPCEIHTPG